MLSYPIVRSTTEITLCRPHMVGYYSRRGVQQINTHSLYCSKKKKKKKKKKLTSLFFLSRSKMFLMVV